MEIQYFKSAWGDIKNSPGWFGKLCLLALVNLIPVFGQIVTFGYLYGWAREIAWGVHEPMPRKLIANEDGKFWRRGWFVLVLTFVFAAVPQIVIHLGDYWQGLGFVNSWFNGRTLDNPLLVGFGSLLSIAGWIALLLGSVLAWIGAMRIAIYDRLSAGFQLGKLWKMLRHDTGGIVRIFGMELLFSFVLGMIFAMVVSVLFAIVIAVGVAGLVNAGYSIDMLQYMTNSQALRVMVQFIASAGALGVFAVLVSGFLAALVTLFIDMLVIRAVGYWTMQFDVPNWDGQDDPMPFELADEPEGDSWTHEPPRQPQAYPQPGQPFAGSQPSSQSPEVPGGAFSQPSQPQWTSEPEPPAEAWRSGGSQQSPEAPVGSQPPDGAWQASQGSSDAWPPAPAPAVVPVPLAAEPADEADRPLDAASELSLDVVDEVREEDLAGASAGALDEGADGLADPLAEGADEELGVMPGFTYAGIDRQEFPAALEPASDPIARAEEEAVSYDEPAIVGAEFLIAPETIEELKSRPDDSDDADEVRP